MTKLNPVNIGMNKYCGPAVLSILTGKSTDECAYAISSVNGRYRVEGVDTRHLLMAAGKLGFDHEATFLAAGFSLYFTLVRISKSDGMYIVVLPDHFVAVEVNDRKIYFCDNHTKEPINAAASARLNQKVSGCYKVFKRPEVVIPPRPEPVEVKEPVLVSSKIEANRQHLLVEIYRRNKYDIPHHDTRELVTSLLFNNEQELEEFIAQISWESV